jgi:hypothetical protein
MRTEVAPSYPVSIFMAGDYETAINVCGAYCDDVGLCVTVTLTDYVYTKGCEGGLIIGLINYPRFPAEPAQIEETAFALGALLRDAMGQESFAIQTPVATKWFSWREADLAQGMPSEGPRPKGSGASAPASPVAKRCAHTEGDR